MECGKDGPDAILIAGPTASGKSALAMQKALEYGGVVVNADSMQVYEPLRILTARPTAAEERAVEHRLYGHVGGETAYSVGAWYRDVSNVLGELRSSGRLPVIVGGTGLYFRALTEGLSAMPEIPREARNRWRERLAEIGPSRLHRELAAIDPETAHMLSPNDGQRIVRALEVFDATGRSIRSFQEKDGVALVEAGRAEKIFVCPERPVLHRRIAERAAVMMRAGAVDEVRALLARGLDSRLPVMKAIGVGTIAGLIEERFSAEEAEARLAIATRQYAKRQMTWFRNQLGAGWQVVDAEKE